MSEWVELRVKTPRSAVSALSALAFELGALGVEEAELPGSARVFQQPWDTEAPALPPNCCLKAWFDPAQADAAARALEASCGVNTVERVQVAEEDWAESWKQHHHRVVVSERLRVSPPWEAQDGDLIITPGQAFGTGDHPTTLACLRGIDRLASSCTNCLDVGCGSGVLALAAVQLGLSAMGVDIEADAVTSAQENAALNGLQADFSTTPVHAIRGRFDLVVANLYAEVLTMLAPELLRLTGRHLVLAGVLAERAAPLIDALSLELSVVSQVRDGEWLSLHLERQVPQ